MRGLSIVMSAALLAGATSAWSSETGESKLTPKAAAAVEKARALEQSEQATVQSSGSKAAKDRDTGKLRAPTPEEERALAEERQVKRRTSVHVNADGSVTAKLGDEHLSDVVAVKNADGSVTTTCAPHEHAAEPIDGKAHDHQGE